jgi:Holliday junction resolvasome RuvABC endonuclease subunit
MNHPGVYRVMGIDPSTTNMGVWFVDVNIEKPEPFQLVYGNTIYGEKILYDVPVQFDDLASTRVMARSYCMGRSLGILIDTYKPDTAICEDNFLGMSALTFKQLIQCVGMLRETCTSRDVHLSMVLPNLAKAIVGVTGRGMTKDDVAQGLLNYTWLNPGDHDLALMDEHSVDAGAVTLYRCEVIAKHYGVFPDDRSNPDPQ